MEEKAIAILKACAWIVLIAGIGVGISKWVSEQFNPPLVIVVIESILVSVVGWALLLVVCSIAESLIEIRINTAQPLESRLLNRELE